MDKETLSNYGWIVICVLVLAVMIALAGPFGNFISDAVKSTTQGLFDVNQNALNSANVPGLTVEDQVFEVQNENGGAGYDHNAPELHPNDGTTPQNEDTYEYGDYIYTYKESSNGWKVAINTNVTDKNQPSYGVILESINGQPVTNLYQTFSNCAALTTAPVIPSSVTNIEQTFYKCTSLTTAPEIPNSVSGMKYTFHGCTALTTAPEIPGSVSDMQCTFYGCTSLTTAPKIPESVKNMWNTFTYCESLTTAPDMSNATVTILYQTFSNCTALTTAPVIPNSVTSMYGTFQGCTALTTAPVIPNSVTSMIGAFNGCTSLTGTITINATPTRYSDCLKNTQITEILGSCENKTEILGTK